MFLFKDIKNWSKKKLRAFKYAFNSLYAALIAVVPTIIICWKYQLFTQQNAAIKLTGIGLILVLVLGFYAYLKLKEAINKLPQITYKQQCFKFGLSLIFCLMPYALVIFGFWMARSEVQLAYDTMLYCLISIFVANIVDYGFLKFIQCEDEIRNEALYDKEKDDRRGLV